MPKSYQINANKKKARIVEIKRKSGLKTPREIGKTFYKSISYKSKYEYIYTI